MSYVLAQAIDEILPQIKLQWQPDIAECIPWRINTSIKGVLRLPKEEQKKLWSMLQRNEAIYKFILQHVNIRAKIVLKNFHLMRMLSIIYNTLRNIKKILKQS